MLVFKPFAQNNPDELYQLIRDYPFANVISHSSEGLMVDHIPFVVKPGEARASLQGHIAKANPLWQTLKEGAEVLVVFQGPQSYISPNYYPSKKIHGKAVPTWNYAVVHVRGSITYKHDEAWKRTMLTELSESHEREQATPWELDDAPEDYLQKMFKAIVGIEITIESITGQWKLSQNQPQENRLGVIEGLSKEQDFRAHEMADWVKRYSD